VTQPLAGVITLYRALFGLSAIYKRYKLLFN
jgi:hypothetical protein